MIGINVGLRIGDLLQLKFGQFYDRMWQPIRDIYIVEQKTSETKGEKRITLTQKFYRQHADLSEEDMVKVIAKMVKEGREDYAERKKRPPKERYIYANDMVFEAMDILRANASTPPIRDNYLFRNESRNSTGKNKPINPSSAWRAMDGACKDLGIEFTVATHGLRKTFGYHFMEAYGRSDAALQTLQRMFGHSSPIVTLRYIGIEAEDFAQGYRDVGERYQATGGGGGNNIIQFPIVGSMSKKRDIC
jgi:integrase